MLAENGVEVNKPREACGVFGVLAPGSPVAHMSYLGLYALQHRGQESAGIAVSDGHSVTVVKDMGLVSSAFDDRILAALEGEIAIGHTRYSTTGSSSWRASQPFYRDVGNLEFALAHNGNLVNIYGFRPWLVNWCIDMTQWKLRRVRRLATHCAGTHRVETKK